MRPFAVRQRGYPDLPPPSPFLQTLAVVAMVILFLWASALQVLGFALFTLKFAQIVITRLWRIATGRP